jgi:hypothetical protein
MAIAVAGDDGSGEGAAVVVEGGGGGAVAAPGLSTYALTIIGMFALEAERRGRRVRPNAKVAIHADSSQISRFRAAA